MKRKSTFGPTLLCMCLFVAVVISAASCPAVAASSDPGAGSLLTWSPVTVPLYRLKLTETAGAGESSAPMVWYAYTCVDTEHAMLKGRGWADDGIATYIARIPVVGFVNLFRWVHPDGLQYYLTTDIADDLSSLGWIRSVLGLVRPVSAAQDLGVGEEIVYLHIPFISEPAYMSSVYVSNDASWSDPPAGVGYSPAVARALFRGWTSEQPVQTISIEPFSDPLVGGDKIAVRWQATNTIGVSEAHFSMDDGANWALVAKSLPTGAGQFEWVVPNVTSAECRLMLRWTLADYSFAQAWATGERFAVAAASSPAHGTSLPAAVPAASLVKLPSALGLYTLADASGGAIVLGWVPNVGEATSYQIERASSVAGPFSQVGNAPPGATTFRDTSVQEGQNYWYRIRAVSSQGPLFQSGTVQGAYFAPGRQTPEPPEVMPPSDLQGTRPAATIRTAQLSWAHSTEARLHHYLIERRTTGDWQSIAAVTSTASSYRDASLSDSLAAAATYRVRAVTVLGRSEPSNEVTVSYAGDPVRPDFDGTQAPWAEPELVLAFQNGLTYPGVMSSFGNKITREEFCTVVVKLYEKLTGAAAQPGVDPFVDTDNPDILKAYALGIVNGVSATHFAPANNITRQEICVMIYRALRAAGENTTLVPGGSFPFTDAGEIATWAATEVRFCYQNLIMKGMSPTTIVPKGNTTREQAIVLLYRTFDSFK